jgi:hypothetical protein
MQKRWQAWFEHWLSFTRQTAPSVSRAQIIGLITGVGLLAGGILAGLNAFVLILLPHQPSKWLTLLVDFIGLALLWAARRANQRGHTRPAAHIALTVMVAYIVTHIPDLELERQIILFALPTMLASFIITPASSFTYALLSTIDIHS